MKHSSKWFIGILVVAASLVVSIGYYMFNKDNNWREIPLTKPVTVIVPTTPIIVTSDWKIYTDEMSGVEFKYPPYFVSDSPIKNISFVNQVICKHDVSVSEREKNFCFTFTFSISDNDSSEQTIGNSPTVESVGVGKEIGIVYDRESSGATVYHSTSVKKSGKWYVFAYSFNGRNLTGSSYQEVKDNFYAILSTVKFDK